MNATFLLKVRHSLLVLLAATILAIATSVAPAFLDNVAGTAITAHVYACEASGGGC